MRTLGRIFVCAALVGALPILAIASFLFDEGDPDKQWDELDRLYPGRFRIARTPW